MSRRIHLRHHANRTHILPCAAHPVPPDAIQLSYELHGNGPQNLLFISGMCVSSDMWQHQLSNLLAYPQYTICMLDNRGSGHSDAPSSDGTHAPHSYSMSLMARDALAIANHVFGSRSKLHLIGHSMGGMIAQRLALILANHSQIDRIASLSLVSSHAGGWFWNNFPSMQLVFAGIDVVRSGFDERVYADVHMRLHYTNEFLNEMTLCEETGDKVSRSKLYYNRYLSGIQAEKKRKGGDAVFWGHLAAVRTHFLTKDEITTLRQAKFAKMVIYGAADGVVVPRASTELAKLINSASYQVDGAHFVVDEARHEVNRLLRMNFSLGERIDSNREAVFT